jgi:hypothetical protein
MSNLNLFIDTTANQLLQGLNAPNAVEPTSLPFWLGDTLNLQIYLLNKTGSTLQSFNPYTIISNAGLALVVYIDNGLASGTIYTQQITFTNDPGQQYFYAPLALNTAALATLLGQATSAPAYLHVGYLLNGLMTTVLTVQISIGVGVYGITGGALNVVPIGLTPLSQQAAVQEFVSINGLPGQGFILCSPNGKKILLRVIDNPDLSAEFQASPIN